MAASLAVVATSPGASGLQQALSLIAALRGDGKGNSGIISEKIATAKRLREVIDKYPANEYREFLRQFLHVVSEAIQTYPAQLMDSDNNTYRAILVETIARLPQNEVLREYAQVLARICLTVIENDIEDNAIKCIRVFFDMMKNLRPPLKDMVQSFVNFVCKLYMNFDETVAKSFSSMQTTQGDHMATGRIGSPSAQLGSSASDLAGRQPLSPRGQLQNVAHSPRAMAGPAGSQMSSSVRPKQYIHSCNSFRVITECPMIAMFLFQPYKDYQTLFVKDLVPRMLDVISKPFMDPSNRLAKNQVYTDFRAAQVKTVSFLTFFLRNFSDQIVPHQEIIANSIVILLTHCPENVPIRKELLAATRHIVTADGLKKGFSKHIDKLLNESVIIGRGLACYEHLRSLAYSLLAELIVPFRMDMSFTQISKIIHVFARNVHDSSLALSIQIISVRLMLNLVEVIFSRSKNGGPQILKDGRYLVSGIHFTFVTKLGEMAEEMAASTAKEDKMASSLDSGHREVSRTDKQAAEQTNKEIAETKQLVNFLIKGMKPIMYSMTNLSLLGIQLYGSQSSGSATSGNDKVLSDEELQRTIRLIRYGVKCLKIFRDTNAPNSLSQNNSGKVQSSFTDFADIFSSMEKNNFMDVFSPFPTLHLLYTSALEIDAFFKVFEHFLSPRYKMYSAMAELLLDFLVTHQLDDLSQPESPRAKLFLRLFKLIEKLVLQNDTLESLLQPHISKIVERFIEAAKSQGNPSGYCDLLLILFQAVSNGKSQVFYREFPSYLQKFLAMVNFLLAINHEQRLREKLVELILILPMRLDSLLPYLKLLMNPLLLALRSGNMHLTRLGLNTFTFWVDTLNPEFLQPEMASLEADLLQSLWNLVRPPPFPFGQQAFLLLGKIGGGARRSNDFTTLKLDHKKISEHGVRIGLCFQPGKPFILPMDRSVSFAISKVLGKSQSDFYSKESSAELEVYYRRCALALLRTYLCGVLNITNPESPMPKTHDQLYHHLKSNAQQPSRLRPQQQRNSQAIDDAPIKTKTMLKAEESIFCQIVEAVVIGSFELEEKPDINTDASSRKPSPVLKGFLEFKGFVPMLCRHMAFVFAISPRNLSMSHSGYSSGPTQAYYTMSFQPSSSEEINPLLFIEALVTGVGRPDPKHSQACLQALSIFISTCLELHRSQLYDMGVAKELMLRLSHGCFSIDIAMKEGCIKALKDLLPKILPFCTELEYRLFRGFLSALKGHKNLSPNIFAEVKEALVWLVENVHIQALQVHAPANQNQQLSRDTVFLEVLETVFFPNSSKQLRTLAFEVLQSIARRIGAELPRLLRGPTPKYLYNILVRPFRSFSPEGQIGVVQVLKISLQLRPAPLLAPSEPRVAGTLIDALHVAEEDESADHSMTAEQRDMALELRISCVELLVAFLPFQNPIRVEPRHNVRQGVPQAQLPSDDLRTRVIMLLLKLLGSGVPELVRLSSQELKGISIRSLDRKILQHSLQPMLSKLDNINLSLPLLDGLQHVLELVSSILTPNFGDRLLTLLKERVVTYQSHYQDENDWKKGDHIKIFTAILKLLHLLPDLSSNSQMDFTEKVVRIVFELEKIVNSKSVYSSRYSPFRAPFAMYLSKCPAQTIRLFCNQISVPQMFNWFLDILRLDEALPIREEICKNPRLIIFPALELAMPKPPPSAMAVERSGAEMHGVRLIRLIVKLHPDWLQKQRDLFETLMTLWRSLPRQNGLRSDDEMPQLEVRETKWILKCILNYVSHNRREVSPLFEIAAVLTYKIKPYFKFVKEFYLNEVAKKHSCEERKQILNYFLELFKSKKPPLDQLAACLRFIFIPILEHIFEYNNPEKMEVLDSHIVTKISKDLLDSREEILQEYNEAIRVELLKLSTLLIKNIPDEMKQVRKELLHFGWSHAKRDEQLSRQWAHVNLCQFFESYVVPENTIMHIYYPLLKMSNPESRPLTQKALDILIPILPVRLTSKADHKCPSWIRCIRRVLIEDSGSVAQTVLIWNLVIKHEHLFFPARDQFVPQMVYSLSRLGLSQSAPLDNRKLAVELAALIIKWDEARLSYTAASSQSHVGISGLVGSKRGNSNDPMEVTSTKRIARETDGSRIGTPSRIGGDPPQSSSTRSSYMQQEEEWAPASLMCELTCTFLIRIALLLTSFERKDDEVASTLKSALDLLQRSLRMWSASEMVNIKPQFVEKLIEQSNLSVPNNIIAMFQVFKIVIEEQGGQFVPSNGRNLLVLLERGIDSKNPQVQSAMLEYVKALFKSFSHVLDPSWLEFRRNLIADLNKRMQAVNPGKMSHSTPVPGDDSMNQSQLLAAQKPDEIVSVSGCVAVFQCATELAPIIAAEMMSTVFKQLQKWAKDYSIRAKTERHSGTSLGSSASLNEKLPRDFSVTLEAAACRLHGTSEFRKHFVNILSSLIPERNGNLSAIRCVARAMKNWMAALGIEKRSPMNNKEIEKTTKDIVDLLKKLIIVDKSDRESYKQKPSATIKEDIEGVRDRNEYQIQNEYSAEYYRWRAELLDLIFFTCSHERLPNHLQEEVFTKIERAHMLGFSCSDPDLRFKFLGLYNRRMPLTPFRRLQEIFQYLDWTELADTFWLKQALSLFLSALKNDTKIEMAPRSAVVPSVTYGLHDTPAPPGGPEMNERLHMLLGSESDFLRRASSLKIGNIIYPLQELSFNDASVADQLWVLLLPVFWSSLEEREQTDLVKPILAFVDKSCHESQTRLSPNVPQPRIPSEGIRFIAKKYNGWYIAASTLECHIAFSMNEFRCADALTEIYKLLGEDDTLVGLWKRRSERQDTKLGLFMDQQVVLEEAQDLWYNEVCKDVRTSENQSISRSEVCLWESKWIEAAKELSQWETLRDFAKAVDNKDLLLESLWKIGSGDWRAVDDCLNTKIIMANEELGTLEAQEISLIRAYSAIHNNNIEEAERLRVSLIEQSLKTWSEYPKMGMAPRLKLLMNAQRIVELGESLRVVNEMNSPAGEQNSFPTLREVMETWRLRLPNFWDKFSHWQDVLIWRNHMYNLIIGKFDSYSNMNPVLYSLGYHNKAWGVNKLAATARKHGFPAVAEYVLNDMYGYTQMEVLEAFVKLREQAKAFLCNSGEFQKGLNILTTSNLDYFQNPQHKAEIFRLRGEFFQRMGNVEKARECFTEALSLHNHLSKGWLSFGYHCDSCFTSTGQPLWLEYAVACYLQAVKYGTSKARICLPRILMLLSFKDSADGGKVSVAIRQFLDSTPLWIWLVWIPQLLMSLHRNAGGVTRDILTRIARDYPQALYYHLRTFFLEKKSSQRTDSSGATGSPQSDPTFSVVKALMDTLKQKHHSFVNELEPMLTEISCRLVPRPEERLMAVVYTLLTRCYKHMAKSSADVPDSVKKELESVCRACFGKETVAKHCSFAQAYREKFEKDLSPDSKDFAKSLGELSTRLKQWISLLQISIEQTLPSVLRLEEESRTLGSGRRFLEVEIPGQYLADQELSPDSIIKLDALSMDVPIVRRHASSHRRLTMLGSDGKTRSFLIQTSLVPGVLSDERTLQLMRAFNQQLLRRKDTRCRNLLYYCPDVVHVHPQVRMVDDDESYITLGEIFEIHCERYGREADAPIILFKDRICDARDPNGANKIKLEAFEEIEKTQVSDSILFQYMYKIFPTSHHLWTFKKKFCLQLALSGLMGYLLKIGNRLPRNILISKEKANVFHSDFHCLYDDMGIIDNREAVPFRLTRNIVVFVSPFAVEGTFKTCLVAGAKALKSPRPGGRSAGGPLANGLHLRSLLGLYFKDEVIWWGQKKQRHVGQSLEDKDLEGKVEKNIKIVFQNIESLAPKNKFRDDYIQVYRCADGLVSSAQNLEKLCQMDALWHPWF